MTYSFDGWRLEAAKPSFKQSVISEWIATFMFIFGTIGCVVFTQDGGISTARQLEVALVFGLSIAILIFIFAGISGANINPAVSFGLMLTKRITPFRCVAYSVAQCLGAICGAGFVRILSPDMFDKVDGGANEILTTSREAFGVEFACTFFLVLTVLAATDADRVKLNPHLSILAPLIIGLSVTVSHFIAVPVDNCSINPARSFGVSVVSGNWNDHWVFWFGPLIGAAAAGLCYTKVLMPVDDSVLPLSNSVSSSSSSGSSGQTSDSAPIVKSSATEADVTAWQ